MDFHHGLSWYGPRVGYYSKQNLCGGIGITIYQNPDLSTLRFADRIVGLSAGHLQSKAGGVVPLDNIRLLLNESARIAAIYDALNWLQERRTSNDKAYFYFSGHEDVQAQKNAADFSSLPVLKRVVFSTFKLQNSGTPKQITVYWLMMR